MKKILTALLCLSLVACSSKQEEIKTKTTEVKEEETKVEAKYKSGELIQFGSYEQDGDTSNGEEPLEWIVIHEEDGKTTLLSKNILELQSILPMNNDKTYFDNSWGNGSERDWLNTSFLENSFSEDEKDKMVKVTLDNGAASFKKEDGITISTAEEEDTQDYVYTLSVEEFQTYVEGKEYAKGEISEYIASQLSYLESYTMTYSTRSRNLANDYPIIVTMDGILNTCVPGTPGLMFGIRPVITIKD